MYLQIWYHILSVVCTSVPFIAPNLIVNFGFPNQILSQMNWHRNVPYPWDIRSSLSPIVKNLPTGTVCQAGSLPIGKFAKWATIFASSLTTCQYHNSTAFSFGFCIKIYFPVSLLSHSVHKFLDTVYPIPNYWLTMTT